MGKAIKFIIYFYKTYKTRTINNVLNAIEVYGKIDKKILARTVSIKIINKMNKFIEEIFDNISSNTQITDIINDFNQKIK